MAERVELGRRDPEARRQAILEAALTVFAAEGFASTKLDDVAEKAGVAKGTIYLYFRDKRDLFEQLVRDAVLPVIASLENAAKGPDLPAEAALATFLDIFRTEILGTNRKHVLRLVMTEGQRFPAIAEFYYQEVVSRGLGFIGALLQRAKAKGALPIPAVARFPQLVVAPLIMAVIWDSLFARIEPLDVDGLLAAHSDLLLGRSTGENAEGTN